MLMRRRCRHPVNRHRQIDQLDLFGSSDPIGFDRPTWRMLPEETRRAATDLMARLLLEHRRHGCVGRLTRTGVADDV
jgi:hypothetical protein